nr:metal tolerance protein C2-like [Aegilops tauschii subsp. strangulata]
MPGVLRFDPRRGETTRPMLRLALLLALNAAYSAMELVVGLLTGRVGLVFDTFHLTFGCGLLSFSLFAMATSRTKPDSTYTYGYKRLEVLTAFTNATREQILRIDEAILNRIEWNLTVPTPYVFLAHFARAASSFSD